MMWVLASIAAGLLLALAIAGGLACIVIAWVAPSDEDLRQ